VTSAQPSVTSRVEKNKQEPGKSVRKQSARPSVSISPAPRKLQESRKIDPSQSARPSASISSTPSQSVRPSLSISPIPRKKTLKAEKATCDLKCRPCYKPDVVCFRCVPDLAAKKGCNPCAKGIGKGKDGMTGDEFCAATTKNEDYKCCPPWTPCMKPGGVMDKRTDGPFNSRVLVCAKTCGWKCDKPKPISEPPCTIGTALSFIPRPDQDDNDGDADDDDTKASALAIYLCDSLFRR